MTPPMLLESPAAHSPRLRISQPHAEAGHVPDEELMARIQLGNREAFEQLYRRYRGLLRALIDQNVSGPDDVDDVLQQVLREIWVHANSYCSEKGKVL